MQQIVDTVNQADGQEDESVQSNGLLVEIDSILAYIAQKNLGVELSVIRCLTK